MSNFEHKGVVAQRYPGDESKIQFDATDFGMLEGSFDIAIRTIGNDTSASWPSQVDDEVFKITYLGKGETMSEGSYWGIWLLTFDKADKILSIDVGAQTVRRLDGSDFVEASFRDISDITAAYFSLDEYTFIQRETDPESHLRGVWLASEVESIPLDQDSSNGD